MIKLNDKNSFVCNVSYYSDTNNDELGRLVIYKSVPMSVITVSSSYNKKKDEQYDEVFDSLKDIIEPLCGDSFKIEKAVSEAFQIDSTSDKMFMCSYKESIDFEKLKKMFNEEGIYCKDGRIRK